MVASAKQQLQAHLLRYLQLHFPSWQVASIQNVERLPAGWESDLYSFTFSYQQNRIGRTETLVLRVFPGENACEKSRHEYRGLQLLYQAGYPVPIVYALESHPSPIGRAFIIMDLIPGEVMWSLLEQGTPQGQAALLDQFCRLFVRLHDLDWKPFVIEPAHIENGGETAFADNWIANARRRLEADHKHDFLTVLDWIEHQRMQMYTEKPALIHGDFHPNNVIIRPDGFPIVIDWTAWQVTDFRFDLAWTLLLAGAYVGEELRQQILAAYEKDRGKPVENIEVFEVCACLRRLHDITASLTDGAESQGMRPETVDLMRSQMGPLMYVTELLHTHTGIVIPEVEALLQHHRSPKAGS